MKALHTDTNTNLAQNRKSQKANSLLFKTQLSRTAFKKERNCLHEKRKG